MEKRTFRQNSLFNVHPISIQFLGHAISSLIWTHTSLEA